MKKTSHIRSWSIGHFTACLLAAYVFVSMAIPVSWAAERTFGSVELSTAADNPSDPAEPLEPGFSLLDPDARTPEGTHGLIEPPLLCTWLVSHEVSYRAYGYLPLPFKPPRPAN